MGTLDAATDEGFPLLADIAGHPAMTRYRDDGFEIISF
jgi:hypothetical protein